MFHSQIRVGAATKEVNAVSSEREKSGGRDNNFFLITFIEEVLGLDSFN